MRDPGVSITAEPFDSGDARRLIIALDATLSELYPPEQRFGPDLKAEHLGEGRGTFLLARIGDEAVGCGAFRRLDATTAEAPPLLSRRGGIPFDLDRDLVTDRHAGGGEHGAADAERQQSLAGRHHVRREADAVQGPSNSDLLETAEGHGHILRKVDDSEP